MLESSKNTISKWKKTIQKAATKVLDVIGIESSSDEENHDRERASKMIKHSGIPSHSPVSSLKQSSGHSDSALHFDIELENLNNKYQALGEKSDKV